MKQRTLVLAVAGLVLASGVHAAGSSATRKRREERERREREVEPPPTTATDAAEEAEARRKAYEQARRRETEELSRPVASPADLFGAALDLVQDADRLAMAGDMEGATATYRRAAEQLEQVVGAAPRNHEAWNQLGYARRSAGEYPAALTAYQEALELEPGFAPAIEYRAEAHLALDRLEEAQEAYQTLFADPDHRQLAATLMHAMEWYVKVKEGADPAPEGFAGFRDWVAERQRLAAQVDAGAGDW